MERQDCPVCFSALIAPVFQCHDGHLICEPCLCQLTHCPICRDQYPERRIRARGIENVIQGFLKDCKNKKFGCPAQLHTDDVHDHETQCKFTSMPSRQKCPGLDDPCDEYFKPQQWAHHLESVHQITGTQNYQLGTYIQIKQDYSLKEIQNSSIKILSHFIGWQDQKFYVRTQISPDKKFVGWTVTCDEANEKTAGLRAVIKFLASSASSEDFNLYSKWSGTIVPNRTHKFGRPDNKRTSMFVPVEQLKHYSDQLLDGHYFVDIMVKLVAIGGEGASQINKLKPTICLQSPTKLTELPQTKSMALTTMLSSDLFNRGTHHQPQPPLKFHQFHGNFVKISSDFITATCIRDGVYLISSVFSDRPLKVGEKVSVRVSMHKSEWKGHVGMGVSNKDPAVYAGRTELEQYDLLCKSHTFQRLSVLRTKVPFVLTMSVTSTGEVIIDSSDPRVIRSREGNFRGYFDPYAPFWAVIRLVGQNDKVQLIAS